MSHSLASSQGILLLYYSEREAKAWGSEMICPGTRGVNTILKIVSSCPGLYLQWPVNWQLLSHFLVLVTWLGVTFRDDGGFYWKHWILSEKSQSSLFYSSQKFILTSLEEILKKVDKYKLINLSSKETWEKNLTSESENVMA